MSRVKKAPCTRCAVPCNSASGLCRPCYFTTPARERSGTFGDFQMRQSHLKTLKARIPEGADMRGEYIATRPDITPEVGHAAALTVCAPRHRRRRRPRTPHHPGTPYVIHTGPDLLDQLAALEDAHTIDVGSPTRRATAPHASGTPFNWLLTARLVADADVRRTSRRTPYRAHFAIEPTTRCLVWTGGHA